MRNLRSPSTHLSMAAAWALAVSGSAQAQEARLPEIQVAAPKELPADLPRPYAGGQVARGAYLGVLGKTDGMQAPVSVTSYTASSIENDQSRSVAEVVHRLDPSVREEYGDGTGVDALMIRGFSVAVDDMALNGLPGILGQFRVSPEFVERVEVLKGPSILLNGMAPSGSVGGSLNVLSKRAGDLPLSALSLGYASSSLGSLNADIGRRFGVDNALGIRLNAGARQGNPARDYMHDSSRNLSLGLGLHVERMRASLDFIHQEQNLRGAGATVDLSQVGGPAPAAPDGHRNLAQPWYFQDSRDRTLMGSVEFDLTDRLTVFGAVGQGRNRSAALTSDTPRVDADGNFQFAALPVDWRQRTTSSQFGLKGRLNTGPVRHAWSLTASQLRRQSNALFHPTGMAGGVGESNIDDVRPIPPPQGVDEMPGPLIWQAHTSLPGYALADTMSFADGRWLLTLGVRHQRVKADSITGYEMLGMASTHYDQSVNSPMVALVFRPSDSLSFYVNHLQGLTTGDTAPYGTANQGAVFAPYRTRQYEAGVKWDGGNLGGTLGVFQITKPYASIDPSNLQFGVFGEQRHRGAEINLYGELRKGVRVLGGAMLMDASVSAEAQQKSRPVGVAQTQLAMQGEWDLPAVPGLTLISRVNHVGKVYADTTNLTRVPGWTVYDLGLRYTTRALDTPVTLRVGLLNAGDKRYWKQGRFAATPGMPRTLAVSSSFAF